MIPRINHPAAGPDLPRIYTGAEAREVGDAVLNVCRACGEAWDFDRRRCGLCDGSECLFVRHPAVCDLAASVEHHEQRAAVLAATAEREANDMRAQQARAERAEAEAVSLRSAVTYLERQVDHEGAAQQATWRVLGGEGSAPNADAVTERAAAVVAERDAASAHAEELTRALRVAQSDLARALADGRVELRQRADDAERVAADLRDDLERLRAERDALRAIVEGRAEPPTTEAPDAR